MLIGEAFLKAETKYRRELLRDQNQMKIGKVGKAATLIVVASIVLAACGGPVDDLAGAAQPEQPGPAVTADPEVEFSGLAAPTPQGNRGLIVPILSRQTVDPEVEFSGLAAPTSQGNRGLIGSILNPQFDAGKFAGPSWHPDDGRPDSDSQLASQPSGPR